MEIETWKHGDIDLETWKHGELKTWRHRDMEIHGDMKTSNGKRQTEA
jgi:hypothetical protein